MKIEPTPSQTVGPFFHYALLDKDQSKLVHPDNPSAIRVWGSVLDGAGEVVPDAMLEIWQANAAGRYAHPEDDREELPLEDDFTGFGRCPTDSKGRYEFVTVKPGVVPGHESRPQAPHILVSVFTRGLLKQLVTRIYFPDEEAANANDALLSSIEDPLLRSTLVASAIEYGSLRFDIRLQGEDQTVFFDV